MLLIVLNISNGRFKVELKKDSKSYSKSPLFSLLNSSLKFLPFFVLFFISIGMRSGYRWDSKKTKAFDFNFTYQLPIEQIWKYMKGQKISVILLILQLPCEIFLVWTRKRRNCVFFEGLQRIKTNNRREEILEKHAPYLQKGNYWVIKMAIKNGVYFTRRAFTRC